ncbi:MAG: extracellular solute-binding protein [Clostridia bacterium]|nr:extracellular solute-binding protein [Clostridia bacterium]
MKTVQKTLLGGAVTLFLVAAMTACAGNTDAGDPSVTNAPGGASDTTAAVTEDPYKLPEADFGGAEVKFLVTEENWGYWHIDEAESTGDVLSDAVYKRNRAVEEALGVVIVEQSEHYSTSYTTAANAILAGEDAFDAMTLFSSQIMTAATEQQLLDVSGLDGLELDRVWWNKNAIDDMAIGDKRFMLIGDLHLMFYESYYAMMFNQDLIAKYDLEDPYQLVSDGKWTYDKLYEMAQTASEDLNGDSAMTPVSDAYGICAHQNSGQSMVLAMGGSLLSRDADGVPVWAGLNENFVDVYGKVAALYGDSSVVMTNGTKGAKDVVTSIGAYNQVFLDGRSLFLIEVVGTLSQLRDMDSNFGIIVMPKNNEADEYISPVYHNALGVCLPVTNADAEMTATVLEAMAIKSHEIVRPVYYETVLGSKLTRDEASVTSLDIVFDSGRFEPAYVYNWGDISGTMYVSIANGKDIVSAVEKINKKIETEYAKTIDAFDE